MTDHHHGHCWLLDMLNTPALNFLAITTPKVRDVEGTHISNFLMRSGGQLQRLRLELYDNSLCGSLGFTQDSPMLEMLRTGHHSGLLLVDLTTCPTLSEIDIHGLYKEVIVAVFAILSYWKPRGLEDDASTVSPFIIRIAHHLIWHVLEHLDVKKFVRQGLQVVPIPFPEETCWDRRLSSE
ncbi:hypothetical protein BD410DRAFT_789400 [Rickenella mellea]|uniref:Uncharacterized protein n=1 Tax=Rickenella mellea TaxID=50990 RepID=A0A4Y7Q2Z2_9AGAM|nr:hypothetical protein BD410DRAFT_789400 [Rickenella mellea]